ncbi:MAG TPA: GNAT family N-acetyltransferase, partial [Pirellulales bacterium]|nr:GNAT family N-acetyltransferase [Pirellulales bacterium]
MVDVLEINDPLELADYRLAWTHLLGLTRGANFFQSLDWLQTYWQHFGAGQRLRVLVVTGSEDTIGILPLVVREERTKLGPVRVLTYPLHDWGTFYGPLGPHPTATLLAGLAHIRRTARDWDVVDLRWVHRHGADAGRTSHAMQSLGMGAYEQRWTEASIVDLRSGWDAYWAGRESRWRNNVRRAEKKLAAHGPIQYLRYRPAGAAGGESDERWDLYDQCESLAMASWQGSSSSGTTLSHDAVRAYLRDAHAAAVHAGGADLNLLLVGGEPAAFAYNYHYRGHVFGLRLGYDSGVAQEGAGHVLMARMLADSADRGDHTFDLGPGSLAAK